MVKKTKMTKTTKTAKAAKKGVKLSDPLLPSSHSPRPLPGLPLSPLLLKANSGGVRRVIISDGTTQSANSNQDKTVQPTPTLIEDATAQTFRFRIPIGNTFPSGNFFVRECYARYYDDIMLRFRNSAVRGITVAGSPGVGTSVFMAYFFLRYKKENPTTTTFILISYDKFSRIHRAREWKSDNTVVDWDPHRVHTEIGRFQDDPNTVFLLDGPPDKEPWMVHRYVVFTHPTKYWPSAVEDERRHRTLYMPLWTLDELKVAAGALALRDTLGEMPEITSFPRHASAAFTDEMAYRFAVFGGVARQCFERRPKMLESYFLELENAAKVSDYNSLAAMEYRPPCPAAEDILYHVRPFESKPDTDDADRCLHLADPFSQTPTDLKATPLFDLVSPFVRKLVESRAYQYVKQLLSMQVNGLTDQYKSQVEQIAKWCPAVTELRQSMLKMKALSLFHEGVDLVANSLAHSVNSSEYDLKLKIQLAESPLTATSSQWKLVDSWPRSDEFESFDAFCVTKQRVHHANEAIDLAVDGNGHKSESGGARWENVELVVFQVAGKNEHAVDGRGLFKLLEQLQYTHNAASRVALVFVVSEKRANSFSRQPIEGTIPISGSLPLTAVDGVTSEMAKILEAVSIHTVRELCEFPQEMRLTAEQRAASTRAWACLCAHGNKAVNWDSPNHEMLEKIPQFVWGIDA